MKLRTVTSVEYGHRIHNHSGQCANLHGHTGKIVIEVKGSITNDTGMLIDFKELKTIINTVTTPLDHTTILYTGDHLAKLFIEQDVPCMVVAFIPTAENLAKYIGTKLLEQLNPTDVDIFQVEFYETPKNCAIWTLGG
jgi:6-pyruvoyltetrahydropterin/6-carboxytetrahydropterin synthase